MLPLRYPRRWRAAGILILALVLALAMAPDVWPWGRGSGLQLVPDKAMHAFTFAFLALWYTGQYDRNAYWRLALGLVAFGAFVEACQLMVSYRTAEWGDLLADAFGILVGMAIAAGMTGGWSMAVEKRLTRSHE